MHQYKSNNQRFRFNSTFRVKDRAWPKKVKAKLRQWVGPKTRAWRNTVVRLKKKYAAMGITTCELRYAGCFIDDALGFAHGRKRRWLQEGELEELCILLCTPCHQIIEVLPPEEMLAIVQSVIANRKEQSA